MSSGHLVANLQLAFNGDKDFDHLNDARRELISTLELLDFVLERPLDQIDLAGRALDDAAELVFHRFIVDANFAPVRHRQLIEIIFGQLLTFVEQHLAAVVAQTHREAFTDEKFLQPPERAFLQDANLIVLILSQPDNLFVLDGLASVVLAQTLP